MKKFLILFIITFIQTEIAFAEKIPDMEGSIWVIKTHRKETVTFLPNGNCTKRYRDIIMRTSKDCTWKQNGNIVTMTGNNRYWKNKLTVSGNTADAIFSNTDGYVKSGIATAKSIDNWLTNASTSNSTSSNNDKISQSKKICRELGFKVNTEKFADCALKMMAMQFETGNKVSNSDGSTTQKIIVKQQDNYDIGDAFFDLQKIIDNNYRSNNSNSGSTSAQRCKIYERAWGADMVCQ
tara:strand:+ start:124 stop:834 length:711 start_codon:yes stop_codon:yes gene_type:complete